VGLLRALRFLFPPKEEQTAIANALSDMDALLGSLEALVAKKQAIKTATIRAGSYFVNEI
jgi:type I restriction enzyme, S subunit